MSVRKEKRMPSESIEDYYAAEFSILKEQGRLVDDWSNVYDHCKKEGEVAWHLACLLNLTPDEVDVLVPAAILHDWYKRKEREPADKEGYEAYNIAVIASYQGLIAMGIPQRTVLVAHSVGHTAINDINATEDPLRRAMFFIDNVVHGNQLVTLDERMDQLEAAPRYKELNESGRAVHNGRTYFEVQRELGKKIQLELEEKAGIEPGSLITVLNKRIAEDASTNA